VPPPQAFGNNQIEGLANGLGSRVAKDGFGTGVPQANNAVTIGKDHGFLGVVNDLLAEPGVCVCCHCLKLLADGVGLHPVSAVRP
jgi:hypothetical protein